MIRFFSRSSVLGGRARRKIREKGLGSAFYKDGECLTKIPRRKAIRNIPFSQIHNSYKVVFVNNNTILYDISFLQFGSRCIF